MGYFDNTKREYIITDMKPRRPLYNYLWNESGVCQCDHFGNGFSWMAIDTQRRDIERGERNVYIKDKTTGEYYSANRNYFDLPFDKHECHVGLGYQRIISEYKGINVEFTVLMPENDAVTLYKVKVKNVGDTRDLGLYFCIQPKPALSWHDAYGYADYSEKLNGLMFNHDGFRLPNDYTKLFVGCDKRFDAYDVGYENFRGEYNGFHNPIGVQKDKLSCKGATFQTDYVAAVQFDLQLKRDEEYEVVFCAFSEQSEEKCLTLKNKYLGQGVFEKELARQAEINNEYCDTFILNSPDDILNTQVNIWLKRQLSLGKTWGRLYGKGYRDVMQDITAFVSFDKALARESIINALKYQYEDGNPIRMFEPNFHYPYNDGGVWITGAVLSYLNESGDIALLNETVPYLRGTSKDSFSMADAFVTEKYDSDKSGSVFEHIKTAIDYLLQSRGKHGLILWLGGDWNDSMNNAGTLGKGESVWLSIATVKAIKEFVEIINIYGNCQDIIDGYKLKITELTTAINTYGKCDGRYIYGINDYDEVIGGKDRIFLNPQTWSVLAGLDNNENLKIVMQKVEDGLKCDFGYLQCYPSFDKGSERIGRVSYFQKGLVENGAVYNHGVAFKIVADCLLGKGDTAYSTLKLISFDNPKNTDNGMEPYAVSNMYMGPENPYIAGYAPMSWITGTAGWIYRAVTEYMCGIKPTVNGLELQPCLPSLWKDITVTRKFRGAIYHIKFISSNQNEVVFNGQVINGNTLPIAIVNTVNEVVYRIKNYE